MNVTRFNRGITVDENSICCQQSNYKHFEMEFQTLMTQDSTKDMLA